MDIKQAASAYTSIAGIGKGSAGSSEIKQGNNVAFTDLLQQSLGSALESGEKAEEVSKLAVMGKTDINSLVTAVNSAELVLQEVVAIRDKVISAYQQIMQMPI